MDSMNNDSSIQMAQARSPRPPRQPREPREPRPQPQPGTGITISPTFQFNTTPPSQEPARPQEPTERTTLSNEATTQVAAAEQSVPNFAGAFGAA